MNNRPSLRPPLARWSAALLLVWSFASLAAETATIILNRQAPPSRATQFEPEVLDLRYAPPMSQACLGLPDDPFKSIIGSDGALYYDYPKEGPEHYSLGVGSFGTRISLEVEAPGPATEKRQSLQSPRVPVVATRYRQGALEIETLAWANTPAGKSVESWSPQRADLLWLKVKNTGTSPAAGKVTLRAGTVNRLKLSSDNLRLALAKNDAGIFCSFSRPCLPAADVPLPALITLEHVHVSQNWGHPNRPASAAFRNVVVSRKQLHCEYAAEKGRAYLVALGFLESYHPEAGKRLMDVVIEDRKVAQVDMIKQYGQNTPAVLTFKAEDLNGDGLLSVCVQASPEARDNNVALAGLWIFPADQAPAAEQILAGAPELKPLALMDAAHLPQTLRPLSLSWDLGELAPGKTFDLAVSVPQGAEAKKHPAKIDAAAELKQAVRFWENAALPYDKLQVADPAVQALLDSCIRNIFQAREIKNGLPAFQVGPTTYRGLWVVDGSFLMEAASFLGRSDEARLGVDYLLSFQRADGGFELIPTHWKETGIVLWAVTRQARLTGDKAWLTARWPRLEKGWEFIRHLRQQASTNSSALYAGLLAPGMSDGGLHGPSPEYTNIYWTLAGMRAAIEAARWLGKNDQADAWQRDFDDFMAAFRQAAQRDLRDDGHGHRCLPITMNSPADIPVQKAQWGFLHGMFPGKLFAADDPLVLGNLTMLQANEKQGLVRDTGWLEQGLWTYFGSFYGHAWLWAGEGRKAAATLYAFGNHASPLLCWREEQMPVGETSARLKRAYVGDMPHNWASAEFVRLVRNLMILERGSELHLLPGLPQAWTKPGAQNVMSEIPTQFGPVTLALQIAPNGESATLEVTPPRREPPEKIVLHLENFPRPIAQTWLAGKPIGDEAILPASGKMVFKFALK